MKTVEVSTSYTYEYDGQYLRFFVGRIEGVPLVEIYSGSTLIYYKPLTEDESKTASDIKLVNLVVKSMKNSKARWYDNKLCQWLADNFEIMTYKERTTTYEFIIHEKSQKVFVTEDYKNHARVHLLNDEGRDKLLIDFDLKEGDNILRACAEYVGILDVIIAVFKENVTEIAQATLLKNMFMED